MNSIHPSVEFVFSEGRFGMSAIGRFLARVCVAVGWSFLLVTTFLALLSDLAWVRWVGVLLGFFLVDRILHRGQGDVPTTQLARRQSNELPRRQHGHRRQLSLEGQSHLGSQLCDTALLSTADYG